MCRAGRGRPPKVTVENSSMHNYNKNGITGNDAGTTLNLTGNYVQDRGVILPPVAAQNGIQLGYGAKGSIISETVIDNVYSDPNTYVSADILLVDTAENSGSRSPATCSQQPAPDRPVHRFCLRREPVW